MRVLQVGKFFPPARGGIETVLRFLTQGLARQPGIELEVLVFNESPETKTELVFGVPLTRLARWEQLFSVPIAPSMLWWLWSRRYDVVHLHVPNPLADLCVALANPARHVVVWYHSDIVRQQLLLRLYAPFERRLLARAARICVSTQRLIDSSQVLRPYRDKCRVIPFGIDPAPYLEPPAEDRAETVLVRSLVGGPFVLFAGRLAHYKGLQYLMEAVRALGCRLVVAGDGPFYAQARLLAQGMQDRVHFMGEVSEPRMRALMGACEVFVLPSISSGETFGLVQLEAMAAARPVINTSLPTGVPEVSLHGVTGLTVPPADVPALAGALRDLLESPETRERLGRAGRERVLATYTADLMAARVAALYRELDGEAREARP